MNTNLCMSAKFWNQHVRVSRAHARDTQVGDSLPDVSVYENDMEHQVDIKEACAGTKVVISNK